MNFNVPQFIDVEDKIAFQMTAKQLGWYAIGGIILFFLWRVMPNKVAFLGVAAIVVIISSAFAFLKPAGMTLSGFFMSGFGFLVKPKVMIWQRRTTEEIVEKKEKKKSEVEIQKSGNRFAKEKALQETKSLAETLDRQSKI